MSSRRPPRGRPTTTPESAGVTELGIAGEAAQGELVGGALDLPGVRVHEFARHVGGITPTSSGRRTNTATTTAAMVNSAATR